MVDNFSYAAYYLEAFFNDICLASGTCFFAKREGQLYLITNWHNATGKNPTTKKPLSAHAGEPNKFRVPLLKDQDLVAWEYWDFPILDADFNPLWLEHPLHKEQVDVIALRVKLPAHLIVYTFEEFLESHNENTEIQVGNDVFVLGFPFGLTGGGALPIWKRASIASEPVINIDNLPRMYIDTASRPGMSGSPVLYKEKRAVGIGDPDAGSISWYYTKLVGIYSGRIGAEDELKAQLGIVWRDDVIDEIILQQS
ncbi:MAG: trypsin-like peptidase domain-containing protein [Phycisphaerae bacterium]|nr:trypsin-like peptidase domain-containing protein [Saprospiraceae bacterium]